jgi:hypothetical protein
MGSERLEAVMGVELDPLHDANPIPVLNEMPYAGQRTQAPPADQIPSIMASIEKAVKDLPPDVGAALVGKVTGDGWNAGVIVRAPHGWNVHAWVGDNDWIPGKMDYGVEVLKTWTF